MSSSFSRSIRALQQTSEGKSSFWGILFLGGLLAVWALWFLTAPIPRYAVASSTEITGAHGATAVFPAAALRNIAVGQSVSLSVDAFPRAKYGTITAVVAAIRPIAADGTVEVKLTLQTIPPGILPQRGLTGQAQIATGVLSPAAILLSTLRQKLTMSD